jgi:hypothetical protein
MWLSTIGRDGPWLTVLRTVCGLSRIDHPGRTHAPVPAALASDRVLHGILYAG